MDPASEPVGVDEAEAASLSDFAADERLGTPPLVESAAEMGLVRSVTAARAKKDDIESLMMYVSPPNPPRYVFVPRFYGM